MTHKLAGETAPQSILENIPTLMSSYYTQSPNMDNVAHHISFGTSGHRGCSLNNSFNEWHIWAVSQAIVDYRRDVGITGPLFMGKDSHALSEAALRSALEVFAANHVDVVLQSGGGYTPTPVISYAIIKHNKQGGKQADGLVITPSHNPPKDGGIKYNLTHGGPANAEATNWIQNRANDYLRDDLNRVKRTPFERAINANSTHEQDMMMEYINDLDSVLNMDAIAASDIKLGADPLGGSALEFWAPIAEKYRLNISVVNTSLDPRFAFMRCDHDGQIRMDCSSAFAMSGLIEMKAEFDIAFGNDPDADRHGIITPDSGLMNSNHYLAVAIDYLFSHREWKSNTGIGKTLVSSAMIDRVAVGLNRPLHEVPVGFKWFVENMSKGQLGFGGEESAGASFLRKDGTPWSTDKDGIIMNLLAAEITAITGDTPSQRYKKLEETYGAPKYARIDAAANREQKSKLSNLEASQISADTLAGDKIIEVLTHAPANQAPIGGLKVTTENGWFAARPSGTEDIYKIYCESFQGETHLQTIQAEAQALVDSVIA